MHCVLCKYWYLYGINDSAKITESLQDLLSSLFSIVINIESIFIDMGKNLDINLKREDHSEKILHSTTQNKTKCYV